MKNFIRKIENFVCEHCGKEVEGNGYTDHCPSCLWAKHVDDLIPGDRASECGGMMEPIASQFKISNLKFKIKYKCTKCRHEFEVWSAEKDDRESLMELGIRN